VIHTVGPVYRGASPSTERLLESAYQRSLEVARAKGIRSVAFPSISTGVYAYPIEEAAPVALRTVIGFIRTYPEIERVCFVLRSSRAFRAFEEALGRLTSEG
jgi:O-acetyl-ADP-ribose deacetylase (regulator of RNase III)